ncbi:hypothetical protein [uncultured Kordia sp.]|uniref:hypothetical protein n=1 Tax=uncultured Kordia sp. TaxID=507699 RepID=UPI0026202822|nr:hypothetical protein [uncultured Kordia sp.]
MNIQSQLNLFEQKLKRHKINFLKQDERIIIKKASIDVQQLLIYFTTPLILGIGIIIGILLFIIFYGVYLPKIRLLYGLAFLSGFGLIGFAYASLGRIRKKKQENHASKILFGRKLVIETKTKDTTYSADNVITIKNSIEIHGDNILTGTVFLIDKEGNKITILSLEGFKSNHLRDDLVWFENFFKNYLELKQ